MIKIGLDTAVTVYLSIGVILLIIWVLVETRRKTRPENSPVNTLWECPVCFFCYVDSLAEGISRCPRCGTLHKREEERVKYNEGSNSSQSTGDKVF